MDAYSAIDNMAEEAFYKKHFYGHKDKKDSLFVARVLPGQSPQSNPMLTRWKPKQSRRFSFQPHRRRPSRSRRWLQP